MKLHSSFIKLPLIFDVERLHLELEAFAESDWIPHPGQIKGNLSLPLIAVNGEIGHATNGPMQTTAFLDKSPYLQQAFAAIGGVFGRSRLMRLESGCEVPIHSDVNYHWHNRVRIHIPITTSPDVLFYCGEEVVHMAAGEAWIFDSWKMHRVTNNSKQTRVHLVIDTCGSAEFWEMVARSKTIPAINTHRSVLEEKHVVFNENEKPDILVENFNTPLVMSPGEVRGLADELIQDVNSVTENDGPIKDSFIQQVNFFSYQWREIWSLYAGSESGWRYYQELIDKMLTNDFQLSMGTINVSAQEVFAARILGSALNINLSETYASIKTNKQYHFPGLSNYKKKSLKNKLVSAIVAPINRNAKCECGSGKKYKHCCGKLKS
jgi:hypothetical protein